MADLSSSDPPDHVTQALRELDDRWAAAPPRSGARPGTVPRSWRIMISWAVGSAGPVALLVQQGFAGRAVITAVVAAAWELLLRHRPRNSLAAWLLVAAGFVVVPLALWSVIGRAPVLVALAGVFVADAALVEWRPTEHWPRRRAQVASFAMLPLVVAQVQWFRAERIAVSAALMCLSLVVVEAYHRRPEPLARADRSFLRVLVLLGTWIGSAILFVVVAVVLYLPGIAGAARDRWRRRGSRETYWKQDRALMADVRRDAPRPFATTPVGLRRRRHLFGLAVVVVAASVLAFVQWPDRRPVGGGGSTETKEPDVFERGRQVRFADLPAYRGVPWADALKQEQDDFSNEHLVLSPIGGYDVGDFEGRFTTVEGGERRTLEPPDCDCRGATVWLIGGSAAFGLGQRDDHTIASELVRLAAADGIALEVRNLAVPGWTIDQEWQKVEARLDGEPRPDAVLFYGGYNDVLGTVIGSTVHGIDPDLPTRLETADIAEFTERGLDPRDVGTPEELGELAGRRYARVRDVARTRLDEAGVDSLFVFQPDAFASDRQYEAVEFIYETSAADRDFVDRSIETAATELSGSGANLRHLLDEHPRPVFVDLVHTNEEGAELVAARLYPLLTAELGLDRGS
jgi:hypothetical protein